MLKQLVKSFWIGLRRRWWGGLSNAFGAVGAIWTLTELTIGSFPAAKTFLETHGTDYIWLMVSVSMPVFVGYVFETRSVSFKLPTTDTRITLKYADLFAQDANILIGVNEFFDGALGQAVSPSSLHGQFIARNYQGSEAAFRLDVDAALVNAPNTATVRTNGPTHSYPIGTTAVLRTGARRTFLVAMAKTDVLTLKASSTVPLLWDALRAGLLSVHNNGGGEPLALPLIGNAQASINIEPQHLLRLITLALVDFGRSTQLPKQVAIVLHNSCFEQLDIREIARDWKRR
ncbi:macro domain-containing protein [Phenylobacterium sp.]|uniref:macro domain-containing protein n=1 Tax=Phenylobacterium sp. TaxID=1871053 RepID=UPI002C483E68|nr:macro domain-containing protein [Phenylobacterium sp.]HLZ76266.1 macro domain-containing protein [Phenylobacterium sp.]